MITVAVTIMIVVSSPNFCTVQYHTEILKAFLLVDTLQFSQHTTVQQATTDDKDGAVSQFLDDLRISHNVDRRAVNKDIVVLATQGFY